MFSLCPHLGGGQPLGGIRSSWGGVRSSWGGWSATGGGQVQGGQPLGRGSAAGGVRSSWGGQPLGGGQVQGGSQPLGGGQPRQDNIGSTCYMAGGMPLAFTQEDFLVLFDFIRTVWWRLSSDRISNMWMFV